MPARSQAETRKLFRGGTHRTVAPADTLARVRPLMAEMGITRIANVTGLDFIGIPVVMVTRPNSRSIAVAQGKGLELDAAMASGLMESVETYHAERIDLPLKLTSFEELRRQHRVIDLERLPPLAESAFHPKLPLLWIEGQDLIQDEALWLPYELVHTNFTLPYPPGSGCFMASSNGLASGNHRLEAITHAITEVVERDATALWDCSFPKDPDTGRLDLESVDDPYCRELLERYRKAGIAVAVWDATTDIGLPAMECWIMEKATGASPVARSSRGSGCHVAREVALSRALTEAAQDRLSVISGARDDLLEEDYALAGDAELQRKREAIFVEGATPRRFQDVPSLQRETLEDDLAWALERLQAVGIEEVAVVDLTKPGRFDIPVLRVVIPGLEGVPDHPGYRPGPRAEAALAALGEAAP